MHEFFKPKSIAVIGASPKKGKIGNDIFNNLKTSKLKIIPVNVNGGFIGKDKVYKKIADYSGKIDLALIVIPAKFVPQALSECGEKKIKSAIIISAGFGEMGNKDLDNEILQISKKYKIKILGPNCLGLINMENGLNASFYKGNIKKGSISFVSQSGAIGVAILDKSLSENIGFSKFISIGNMANTGFSDYIEYLSLDKETKVICLYIEGINDGEKFVKSVKKCKKPIIVLKAGVGEKAAKAISSHTGSLAGNMKIYESIFRQYGIISANNLYEMFMLAKHLSNNPLPKSKNVCIVTNAGGLGVLSSDACETSGLEITSISLSAQKKLDKILPSHWSKGNPVDVLGDALAQRYDLALKALSNENFYDILLFILTPQSNTEVEKSCQALIDFKKRNPDKAVFSCIVGGLRVQKAIELLKKSDIINFDEPYFFAKALAKLF